MSLKDYFLENLSDSISQGEDFNDLLNESNTLGCITIEDDQKVLSSTASLQKNKSKDTLSYYEEDNDYLKKEISNLRSQNYFLEAQVQTLEREKELHIATHAKEKGVLEAIIKDLQQKLSNDQKDRAKKITKLKQKLQEAQHQLEEEHQKRIAATKKLKNKLETREKELMSIIKDKEKHSNQADPKKSSRNLSSNPKIPCFTKKKQKFSITSSKTKPTERTYDVKSDANLESISNLIVNLEKKQADLSQSISKYSCSPPGRSKKSFYNLIQENGQKLREAKAIQHGLLKQKFSNI